MFLSPTTYPGSQTYLGDFAAITATIAATAPTPTTAAVASVIVTAAVGAVGPPPVVGVTVELGPVGDGPVIAAVGPRPLVSATATVTVMVAVTAIGPRPVAVIALAGQASQGPMRLSAVLVGAALSARLRDDSTMTARAR